METLESMNGGLVTSLRELSKHYRQQGDIYSLKAVERAFSNAAATTEKMPLPLTLEGCQAELKSQPGIGKGVLERVEQYLREGRLEELDQEEMERKLFDELSAIHGVGPATAQQLVLAGVTGAEDLGRKVDSGEISLTDAQRIGLRYYYHFQTAIPRSEVRKYGESVINVIRAFYPEGKTQAEIAGSYRRGAGSSKDIDIIFTAPRSKLSEIVAYLQTVGFIQHVLSSGPVKFQGVYFSEYTPQTPTKGVARRIDIRYVPLTSWPTALLHATGSGRFNILLRQQALRMGYSLSEHGISRSDGGIAPPLTSEADVFHLLGVENLPPEKRD